MPRFSSSSIFAYLFFAMLVGVFVIAMKPIYSGNLAKLSKTFAPVHVALATTGSCDNYALHASTTRKKLSRYEGIDPMRFYALGASTQSLQTCALARNMMSAPLAQLALSAESGDDLARLEFISITMGGENFYIAKNEILAHAVSNTAIPTKQNSGVMIDLSSYKILESSAIINQYAPLWVGFFYYFLTPPYLFVWLFFAFVLLAWRESILESHANPQSVKSLSIPESKVDSSRAGYFPVIALFVLFGLGLLLRIYNYNSFGFWWDELYSVGIVGYPDGDFSSVFLDPGNPPFYNFLLKIWLHIFGYTPESAKSLSVLLGSIGVLSMYIFLKSHALSLGSSIKSSAHLSSGDAQRSHYIALLGAGLFACSYMAIGAAHEVRGYVLVLSLIPLVFYFLFNCYVRPTSGNLIGYVVSASCLCNTHYFGSIVIFAGFVASVVLLWGAWRRLLVLFICDVLVALSLVPFFIITAFSKALGDTSFNTWIPTPSVDGLFMVLSWSLGTSSAAFVLLVLVLCIPKLRNWFLIACVIVMIVSVIVPFGASFIRPIFYPKYAIFAIYPFMLSVLSVGLIQLSFMIAHSRIQRLSFIALGVVMIGVVLFDSQVQLIGIGDNSRAKFRFITQDSTYASRAYIANMGINPAQIAIKKRQYELYGFAPEAEFVELDKENLVEILHTFTRGDTLYFDGYFTSDELLMKVIRSVKELGARVDTIPFGIQADENLLEKQEVIYRVVFE